MDKEEDGPGSDAASGRHGAPRGRATDGGRGSVAVLGATAAELGLTSRDGRPSAHGAVFTEIPGEPVVTPEALLALAAADVAVLVLGGQGFNAAARQLCQLAWHLGGSLPFLITAAAHPDAAQAAADYARALGAPAPVMTNDAQELPGLLDIALNARAEQATTAPLRLGIEHVSAEGDSVFGHLVSGSAQPGLEVVVLPQAMQAVVQRSESDGAKLTVHLDRPITAAAGQILAAAAARPEHADQVAAHILWLAETPLLPGRPYRLRLGGQEVTAQISALRHRIDAADLSPIAARRLGLGEAGLCNLSFATPLLFDAAPPGQTAGGLSRFMIENAETGSVLGAGRVLFTLRRATNIHWQALAVDKAARAALKAQRPCCLWFTGLSGSGKSTVASLLEQRLSAMGRHTYTLDGDNVRHGLNRDLGFTDADRVENIRRVAQVAKLMVDAGLIVMVSFISPFRAEREMARALFPDGEFLEIYVNTPLDICERRDPKGLYRKARAGQLKNFTGIDSPYEPPERAEINLASGSVPAETLVEQVLGELARRGLIGAEPGS